ncbi:MAG: cysteine desulfurase [Candidatus Eisenbacteria bacterium]
MTNTSSSDAQPLDIARIRREFPVLRRKVHGKQLVYLDNAATTQRPHTVVEGIARYSFRDNANVHRGVHELSQVATAHYEGVREKVRDFLGAKSTEEIIYVRGTTEAINLVAASYGGRYLAEGDEVLVTQLEHHSNIVPWQLVCESRGAKLVAAPINDDGEVILDEFERLIGPRTRIVAFSHISNALGTINPVERMTEIAKSRGAVVLIDGAQATAHTKVDVGEIGCDFYTVSAHKMYGPMGIGALYGRKELLDAMPPYQGGGDMIRMVTFEKTVYSGLPHKFEAGTPNVEGVVGFGRAIDFIAELGIERMAEHEHDLLAYAMEVIGGRPDVRVIGTAREKASILSFLLEGVHPHDIGTILDGEGIAIRAGHHCAQPVMDRFGVPATIRASFGVYNTREEIDALARGLDKVMEIFG